MRFWIQLGSMALLLGSASPPGTAPIQPSEPAPVTLPLVAEATLLSTGPVELAQSQRARSSARDRPGPNPSLLANPFR
jgi:hypothetical protein